MTLQLQSAADSVELEPLLVLLELGGARVVGKAGDKFGDLAFDDAHRVDVVGVGVRWRSLRRARSAVEGRER